MGEDPDRNLTPEQLALRDRLAVDRTMLANERTLLAYIRTALAIVIVGGTLIEVFDSPIAAATGWAFIAAGIVMLGLGAYRFRRMMSRLKGS